MVKGKATSTVKKASKKTTSTPKVVQAVKSVTKITLSREQIEESIRLKAYELYLQRMGQDGNALSDWISAEKMVLQTQ